ncbi:neprilysin-1-like [Artemia franciscana]|uniref:neprilysin-1-like n=1 Tax=Artemia franciscana TaxID=6661 RepID=UPI0032DA6352
MDFLHEDQKTCSTTNLRESSSKVLQGDEDKYVKLTETVSVLNISEKEERLHQKDRIVYSVPPPLESIREDRTITPSGIEVIVTPYRDSPYPSPIPSPLSENLELLNVLKSEELIYQNLRIFEVSSDKIPEDFQDVPCVDTSNHSSPIECIDGEIIPSSLCVDHLSESLHSKTRYICEDCLAGSHKATDGILKSPLGYGSESTYSFEVDALLNQICNASIVGIAKRRPKMQECRKFSNNTDADIPLNECCDKNKTEEEASYMIEPSSTKNWPHKEQRFCQRRTFLEKCLFILCILSLLGLITVGTQLLLQYFEKSSLKGGEIEKEVDKNLRTTCTTDSCVKAAASILSWMDKSVDPCEDFYRYSCGSWIKKSFIPEDKSTIGTFETLTNDVQLKLKGLLDAPILANETEAVKKVKTLYQSCMDAGQRKLASDVPILRLVQSLGGWPVLNPNWTEPYFSLEEVLGRTRIELGISIFMSLSVGPDDTNSAANVLQLDQPYLGLPDREYFLSPSSIKELRAYHKYMAEIALLLGADKNFAIEEMKKVINFEIELANLTMKEADRLDAGAIHKEYTLPELKQHIPKIKWRTFLETIIVPVMDNEKIVVYANNYLKSMAELLKRTDSRTIWNYVIWRVLQKLVKFLDERYIEKEREFSKSLSGIEKDVSRWKKCVDLTGFLGTAVGSLFVSHYFDEESKGTAMEMVNNLREAFEEMLTDLDWMNKETIEVAKEKLHAMDVKIGYPDYILNATELDAEYKKVTFSKENFFDNILNMLGFTTALSFDELRKPVDRKDWTTPPAIVNAFYDASTNSIVFPAGILQPFFYSKEFPKSLNYGAIGVVIGHEITHGFDDRGRQYDKKGNLQQWWNNQTIKAYRTLINCFVEQYGNYKIQEIDQNLNGRLTVLENIADNVGLKIAYKAYKKWVERNGSEELLPGLALSHDQLFFLGYAQIWCELTRPEEAVTRSRTSRHPPGYLRVRGPLSNLKQYAMAYSCPTNSKFNPDSKCSVF